MKSMWLKFSQSIVFVIRAVSQLDYFNNPVLSISKPLDMKSCFESMPKLRCFLSYLFKQA